MKKIKTLVVLVIFIIGMGFLKYFYDKNLKKDALTIMENNTTIEVIKTRPDHTSSNTNNISKSNLDKDNLSNTSNTKVEKATSSNLNQSDSKTSNTSNESIATATKADRKNKPRVITNSEGKKKILMPDSIIVYDNDGKEVNLDSFIGKKVLINFWASWCGPCKAEMADLNELSKELGEDTVLVMVNVEGMNEEAFLQAKKYLKTEGFDFPITLFDSKGFASMAYQIQTIPTSVFIDKEGYVVDYHVGTMNKKEFLEGLEKIE